MLMTRLLTEFPDPLGLTPWSPAATRTALIVSVSAALLLVVAMANWGAARLREGHPPRPPRPPQIADAPAPRIRDALRIMWWSQVGFFHGARHGRPSERAVSSVFTVCWWLTLPLLVIIQPALLARPRARYYMTPERDAVLALTARRYDWHLEDHSSAHPGSGRGRALRAQVLPTVLTAADLQGIPIHATAASATLATIYTAEIAGMTDTGPAWPRGRALHREPGTTS